LTGITYIDLIYSYMTFQLQTNGPGCNGSVNKESFAIPAVVVPSFLKTGLSFANPDAVVPGLIPSSTDITTFFSSPVLGSTICRMR
jgi:hypothetical protein